VCFKLNFQLDILTIILRQKLHLQYKWTVSCRWEWPPLGNAATCTYCSMCNNAVQLSPAVNRSARHRGVTNYHQEYHTGVQNNTLW